MKSTREIGEKAELLAKEHLIKLGYIILKTNWHAGHLEIDIIAQDIDELVIVEVKSRYGKSFQHPIDAMTNTKIKRVVEAAESYIQLHDISLATRFDVITVIFNENDYELKHYTDAFYPTL